MNNQNQPISSLKQNKKIKQLTIAVDSDCEQKHEQTIKQKKQDEKQAKANQMLLTQQNCSRCNSKPSQISCTICEAKYCAQCDRVMHSTGKFCAHHRCPIQNCRVVEDENLFNIRIRQVKENQNCQKIQKVMANLNTAQKWDKIIKELQNKFQEFLNIIHQKKQELLLKLQKRKDQQIKINLQGSNDMKTSGRKKSASQQSMKRSQLSQKIQMLNPKIKTFQCQHENQCGKCLGKVEINCSFIQQIKSSLQKLEFKNIITKSVCQSQIDHKKKQRSSILVNPEASNQLTPYSSSFRSPKNINQSLHLSNMNSSGLRSPKSKLSQSIYIDDKKMHSPKINEQQMEEDKLKKAETKMLQKVKSQKLIYKPKNMDLTARFAPNKGKKLELMI